MKRTDSEAKPRVLWFVNTPFDKKDLDNPGQKAGRTWMANLASLVAPTCELHVAYIDPYGSDRHGDRLHVHPIRPTQWRWKLFLRLFRTPADPYGDLLPQLTQIVDRVRPSMIHVHGTELSYLALHEHARRSGIPFLVSLQGITSAIHRKYAGSHSTARLRRTIVKWGWSDRKLLPQTAIANARTLRRSAQHEYAHLPFIPNFAGRTHWDRHIATLFNPAARYFQIDRVLKPAFQSSRWNPLPLDSPNAVLHTTLSDATFKGFEIVAEACWHLARTGLDVEWRIAGLQADSWSVRMARAKLRGRFPDRHFRFLGKQDAAGLVDSMLRSHVYVLSSHSENSPNSLAEAMMLGMPCVSTLAGGSGTYLHDRQTGLLVQSGDPLGMAGAILELLQAPDLAASLGAAARQAALERHDPEKIKAQVRHAYDTLLRESRHTQQDNSQHRATAP